MIKIEKLERRILINDIVLIILLGAIFNISVMVTNDSKMPVYFYENEYIPNLPDDYIAFNEIDEVNNPYLSDIINLRFSCFSFHTFQL